MRNDKPSLYIFDIETLAQPEQVLDAMMPGEIREPRMPRSLEKPEIPVLVNKTLEKGIASAKAKLEKEQDSALGKQDKIAELKANSAAADEKYKEWKHEGVAKFHAEHVAKIEKWNDDMLSAKLKWIEGACLRAETAMIPLICCHEPDGGTVIHVTATHEELAMDKISKLNRATVLGYPDEKELLESWWKYVKAVLDDDIAAKFAGWNSNKFDLGMLRRRSWINRVDIPVSTHSPYYADGTIWLDLLEVWQCGDRQLYVSADTAAKALGVRGKTDHGGNFGAKWRESKTEAVMYCMNDVLCERAIAEGMGYKL